MEGLLLGLALIFVMAGIIFAVLPPLPGPVLSYIAMWLVQYSNTENQFSLTTLLIMAAITAGVTILDVFMPAVATKKFGGTRAGVWGGLIGAVVGIIAPIPFGVIIGPLVGAILGDLIGGNEIRAAVKSGFGSFLGFLIATSLKVLASVIMGVMIVWKVGGSLWSYLTQWMG